MDVVDIYTSLEDERGGLDPTSTGLDPVDDAGVDPVSSGLDSTGDTNLDPVDARRDSERSGDVVDAYLSSEGEKESQEGREETGDDDKDTVDLYLSSKSDQRSDQIAAQSISMNAMGYTDTGMPMGMNPAMAPPEGYVEAENQQYESKMAVEDAQRKYEEKQSELRNLRAKEIAIKTEASSTAVALGSALLNVGVSGPDMESAKKVVGTRDKQVEQELNEINTLISQKEKELEPYKKELMAAKNAMYGQIFKKDENRMYDAGEAATKVRESRESLHEEIANLEKKRDKMVKDRWSTDINDRTKENAAAFSVQLEEVNDTIHEMERYSDSLERLYAEVYDSSVSDEVEPVGLLEDPIFNLFLMYGGMKLGNSFGREALSMLTYGGSDLASLGFHATKGALKLGYKGTKGVLGLGYEGAKGAVKRMTPTNAVKATQYLGAGTKKLVKGTPHAVALSAKAIASSPRTFLKYADNVRIGWGTALGHTKEMRMHNMYMAEQYPDFIARQMAEKAGSVASADMELTKMVRTLKGKRPGKGAGEKVFGKKTSQKASEVGEALSLRAETGTRKLKRLFIDRSADAKELLSSAGRYGKEAIRNFELQAGTPTYAKARIKKAYDEVFGGTAIDDEDIINRMVFARSEIAAEDYLIARSKWDKDTLSQMRKNLKEYGSQVLHPDGMDRTALESMLEQEKLNLIRSHGEVRGMEKYNKCVEKTDKFFDITRRMLDDLRDSGIITDDLYRSLAAHRGEYAPRKILEYANDAAYSQGVGIRPLSVEGPGFKKYYSSEKATSVRTKDMLHDMISGFEKRRAVVETNRSLYHAANALNELDPQTRSMIRTLEKKPASHLSIEGQKRLQADIERGAYSEEAYKDTMDRLWTSQFEPLGKDEVFVGTMIDGEQVGVAMNKSIAEQWTLQDPYMSARAGRVLNRIFGTKILKMSATMYNPAFALKNLPRDLQHAYMTTDAYSRILPLGMMQMASDYKKTFAAAWRIDKMKSKQYRDAMRDGLGMDFLAGTSSNPSYEFTNKNLEDVASVLGFVGESSEVWTRLAIRERKLKNLLKTGMSYDEASKIATHEARKYLDFSQHGEMMRMIDAIFPYSNAAMQASRGIVRAARENFADFAIKSSQIMLAHGVWYNYLRSDHEELYNSLTDYERNSYHIIPMPFISPKIENGKKRYAYVRIAKDQQARPIEALTEILSDIAMNRDVDAEKGVDAVKGLMAIQPDVSALPPLFQILFKYGTNYDFWRDEAIWKGSDVLLEDEYTKYTSQWAVDLGESTGLSPMRSEAVVESYTGNNLFTNGLGFAVDQLKKNASEDDRARASETMLNDIPGLKDIMRYSIPGAQDENNSKRIDQETGSYYRKWRREVTDSVERGFKRGSQSEAYFDIHKKIREAGLPPDEKKRVLRMVKETYQTKRLGLDMSEWGDIIYSPNSMSKARKLWEKYSQLDSRTEQREFIRTAKRAGQFTNKVQKRFNEYKDGKGDIPEWQR